MISSVKLAGSKVSRNITKSKVQFFAKSSSPFSVNEKGGQLNSFLGGAVIVAGLMYAYKKYRRAKLAKGEKLNPIIDNNAKKLNKTINKFVYNTSKIFEDKGFKKFSQALKVLIFKI